ncbi:MAG TPA: wax ester/triacylglycerol synthase family O-acyltransferase [Mycobacteriales bacterium]|nr:wax ester/triacylglycerol synthase family O-acyltransferase [Mycobacteriales bacterium]
MPQSHLDRLTSIDAGFLHQEDGGAHMHIGGLGVFEGPAPTGEQFRAHLESRLPLVPRYRQRIVEMPLGTGRPLWADDPAFRIGYHVRHTALPAPGSEQQLLTLTSRVLSQRLDRTKPLWELWLVEGLEGGRWALIGKTHHAMIDGVGGVDLLTALLDLSPETTRVPDDGWVPRPTPGAVGLVAAAARSGARQAIGLARRGIGLALRPDQAVREGLETAAALAAAATPLVNGAPQSIFNGKPGPHRTVSVVRTQLEDYKAVKRATGATVNDVVLTAVAGAIGRFLVERGVPTAGLQLRACVPVSVRTKDTSGAAGNEITIMAAPLPVGITDPLRRLSLVRQSMQHLKSSRAAEGAKVMTSIENALPPAILARASRLGFSSRLYNLLVTNVPGPQQPIYLMGRRLRELAPLAFLAPEHLLAIAIISYDGQVTYGLLGDADALPDLPDLAAHLEDSLAELVAVAAGEQVSDVEVHTAERA